MEVDNALPCQIYHFKTGELNHTDFSHCEEHGISKSWLHIPIHPDKTEAYLCDEPIAKTFYPRAAEFLSMTQNVIAHRDAILLNLPFPTHANQIEATESLLVYICQERILTVGVLSATTLSEVHFLLRDMKRQTTALSVLIAILKVFLEKIGKRIYKLEGDQAKIENGMSAFPDKDSYADLVSDVNMNTISAQNTGQIAKSTVIHLLLGTFFPLSKEEQSQLQNIDTIISYHLQEITSLKERMMIVKEEANIELQRTINQRIYILTLLTMIFMPINSITSLLGINVGGIPGAQSSLAFIVVTLMLGVIIIATIWTFRKLQWL